MNVKKININQTSPTYDIASDVYVEDSNDKSDLAITDPTGNIILELEGGHIRTKNFDSRTIVAKVVKAKDGGNILVLNNG